MWTDKGGEFTGLIDKSDEGESPFQSKYCGKRIKDQPGLKNHYRACPVKNPEKAKEDEIGIGKDIELYHTEGESKAMIAERFIKTIKGKNVEIYD